MSINSLAISKYISVLGEDYFFALAKNHTDDHQWKNYTVYCLDDIILDVTSVISEKIYIYLLFIKIIIEHTVVPLVLTGKHLQLVF